MKSYYLHEEDDEPRWTIVERDIALKNVPEDMKSPDGKSRFDFDTNGRWCRAEKLVPSDEKRLALRNQRVMRWIESSRAPKTPALFNALIEPLKTAPLESVRKLLLWREEKTILVKEKGKGDGTRLTPPSLQVLGGSTGSGKTVALVYAAGSVEGGLFETATRISSTIRNGFSTSEEAWEEWLHAPTLSIDECGMERTRSEAVGDLIVERWNAGLTTFCAGNLDRAQFAQRYFLDMAARIQDRLVHDQPEDAPWFVSCNGVSLRAKGARNVKG